MSALLTGAEHALRIIGLLLQRHGESLCGEQHVQMMELRNAVAEARASRDAEIKGASNA